MPLPTARPDLLLAHSGNTIPAVPPIPKIGLPAATQPRSGSGRFPNILVPKRRMLRDEFAHQGNAGAVLKQLHSHTTRTQQIFLPHEGEVLADDDPRDTVEQNRTGTHRARR